MSAIQKSIFKARIKPALLAAVAVILVGGMPAQAQSDQTRQFGTAAGQIVVEAQQQAKSQNFTAAIAKLTEALNVKDLKPFERSSIYGMLGQFYYEIDDLSSAISNFEQAVQSAGLTPEENRQFRKQKALLMIGNGQYESGAALLQAETAAPGKPCGEYAQQITQAYIKAENYEAALPCAKAWFAGANPKERKHYDMLNYLYHHTNRQGHQADLLKQMIARWPGDLPLWNNWVSLLSQAGRDEEAFEVKKLLYLSGHITDEEEIKKVVEYYQYYNMPYQAGLIMEREMNAARIKVDAKNLVRLSELFRQAREYGRALPILEKAAQLTNEGKTWAQLGEALYHSGNCERADTVFKTAMDRGYHRGKSWMFVGNCWYERGQLERRPECDGAVVKDRSKSPKIKTNELAISYFKKVPVTAKNASSARKWIEFVTAENQSFDDYCDESERLRRDLCEIKIESAYKMVIIRGEFRLEPKDEYCLVYKEDYDNKYRHKL